MKIHTLLSLFAPLVYSTTMDPCEIEFTQLSEEDDWAYSWSLSMTGDDAAIYDYSIEEAGIES